MWLAMRSPSDSPLSAGRRIRRLPGSIVSSSGSVSSAASGRGSAGAEVRGRPSPMSGAAQPPDIAGIGIRPALEGRGAGDEHVGARRDRERRSEEHTSELQSLMRISYAVFRLKKKNNHTQT